MTCVKEEKNDVLPTLTKRLDNGEEKMLIDEKKKKWINGEEICICKEGRNIRWLMGKYISKNFLKNVD